jgi:hypothetical protein
VTFEEYAKYRVMESLLSWGIWLLVFGVIGFYKLARFIQEVRRNHRNFERMRKEIMEEVDDDEV